MWLRVRVDDDLEVNSLRLFGFKSRGFNSRIKEGMMSATVINLIIQVIAGALGGNGAGAALKDMSLGPLGNSIAGAIGGLGGGQLLSALIPALAGAAGGTDVGALVGQAVGGGIAGAILTVIVGFIKSRMAGGHPGGA
ncbi:MAG TPA: hypothetical protein VGM96_17155 [Reyranella sp.]|jgi:hypothetical protein